MGEGGGGVSETYFGSLSYNTNTFWVSVIQKFHCWSLQMFSPIPYYRRQSSNTYLNLDLSLQNHSSHFYPQDSTTVILHMPNPIPLYPSKSPPYLQYYQLPASHTSYASISSSLQHYDTYILHPIILKEGTLTSDSQHTNC